MAVLLIEAQCNKSNSRVSASSSGKLENSGLKAKFPLKYFPGGNHVADVAKNDEYMEYGMYVTNLLETVQHSAGNIRHTFCYNPEHDF